MDTFTVLHCANCEYQTRQLWRLLKHYEYMHSSDPRFRAQCGIDNCPKAYHNIKALCAHIRSKHGAFYSKHMIAPRSVQSSSDCNDPIDVDDSQVGVNCDISAEVPVALDADLQSDVTVESVVQDSVAMWSLKLREINKISGEACEQIRQHVGTMLSSSRETLLSSVQNKMLELGATSLMSSAICDILLSETPHEAACRTLATEYNVNQYVEANFGYVKPVQYKLKNLDESDDNVEYMQYIPLLESLQELLKNDDIFSAVMNSHRSKDRKLRDFCDGSYCRQHPLFANDEHALQIVLYYDDFGAVNPLGHRAKKYIICAFYFMIANVPPKDRSRLHSIHLAALCFSRGVKRCGFDEVLKSLVNDFVTLAEKGH